MSRGRAFAAALAVVLLGAAPAAAQDTLQQARSLFNAGAQAYEAGQYQAAIQTLDEAYRLAPRPGILFSIAQAHRKQYFVDKQPGHLRAAIKGYREYVAKVEQGGRRGDAVQALAELEPIAERLGAAESAAAAPVERKLTQLMVSAQKEATVLLDGKPIDSALLHEVSPGKHAVRVTAPGYFPEEREIQAAEGRTVTLDISMREQPGLLSVAARDGADVAIDGRFAATTPLGRPIELPSGPHFVAVTKRGYKAFSLDLEIGRGENKSLTVPLEVTGQRIGAYVLAGVAAAGLVTGGTLAAVAVAKQSSAETLANQRTSVGGLTTDDVAQYNSALSARNTFRTAAGVAIGGAAALGATAILLGVFDLPVVGTGGRLRRDEAPKPAAPPVRERSMDAGITPILGPGLYGASFAARF